MELDYCRQDSGKSENCSSVWNRIRATIAGGPRLSIIDEGKAVYRCELGVQWSKVAFLLLMSDSVTHWLNQLGLGQYAEAFNENDIAFDQLADLDKEFLKDIGVTVVGHRMRILKAAASLVENAAPTSPADPGSADADETLSAWERQPGERKPVTMLFAATGNAAIPRWSASTKPVTSPSAV